MIPGRLPAILPTIDVEGVHGARPFEQMIMGELEDGSRWGTFEIARLLEDYGCTGTFFVDVYEDVLWGEAKMKRLCQELAARGHDVQLHTHPSWRNDPRDSAELNAFKAERCRFPQTKDFMAKLSLEEQTAFVAEGKALLEKWLDKPVIAHRSGGYSINQDTIKALVANQIFIDSSMNRAHSNSRLTWSWNQPVRRDGVLELPVSVFRLANNPLAPNVLSRIMKSDLGSIPLNILKSLLLRFEEKRIAVLNLFFHSYTLLNMSVDFRRLGKHHARVERMRLFLDYATRNGWSCMSIAQLMSGDPSDGLMLGGEDFLPTVVAPGLFMRFAQRKIFRRLAGYE